MNDDGWFEIEEEIPVSCGDMFRAGRHGANVQHEFGTHTQVVRRKIRFCEPPSRAAEKWLTEATRGNRADPRLFDMTRY